jgi:diacylglycerol O-acyltransferase
VLQSLRHRLRGAGEPDPTPPAPASMSGPVPRTVLNAPLTKRRAVAFASIPLTDFTTVSNAFGGSITNVFLAATTLSLRAWLQRYDTVPDDPLLIRMPLSLPVSDPAAIGNSMTFCQIRLPVQLDDPVQVLTNLHTATEMLNIACNAEKASPRVDLATVVSLIPPSVAHVGVQFYTGLGLQQRLSPIRHGYVSYVSAQPVPAYCAGAKVVGMHTAAPLVEGCGLSITVIPHGDVMDLCVYVCPDNVPAVDEIATGIEESVGVLVAAAQKSPRGQGRSVVSEITSQASKRVDARNY